MWGMEEEEEGDLSELAAPSFSLGQSQESLDSFMDQRAKTNLLRQEQHTQEHRSKRKREVWELPTPLDLPDMELTLPMLPKPKRRKGSGRSNTGIAAPKPVYFPELAEFSAAVQRKSNLPKRQDNRMTFYVSGIGYFFLKTQNYLNSSDRLSFKKVGDDEKRMIDIFLKVAENEQIGRLDQRLVDLLYDYLDNPEVSISASIEGSRRKSPKPQFLAKMVQFQLKATAEIYTKMKVVADKFELQMTHAVAPGQEDATQVTRDNFSALFGESLENVEDLTGVDPCDDVITDLLQHQRIGLEWLINHENPDSESTYKHMKKVEEKGEVYWEDTFSRERYDKPPVLKGGLLADDMGLGKTLQVISLLTTNSKSPSGASLGPTLVVCPLAVMNNWTSQVDEHCSRGSIQYLKYHGQDRVTDPTYLQDFHMVVTTYHIVEREAKWSNEDGGGIGLHAVSWLRICLDEAHTIRSRNTKKWRACCALKAERRWALTGTPVQNKLDDLQSLFAFIQIRPWATYKVWKEKVLGQLKMKNAPGIDIVREILKRNCLRRTKTTKINGKPIIQLPSKTQKTIKVEFTKAEKRKYDELTEQHKRKFQEMQAQGQTLRMSMNILAMLTRKRQACAHVCLLPRTESFNVGDLGFKRKEVLLEILKENETADCSICDKMPIEPCITQCEHIYCHQCLLDEVEDLKKYRCAICREPVSKSQIFKPTDEQIGLKSKKRRRRFVLPDDLEPSSKIKELIRQIHQPIDGKTVKTVVFSQWTSFLDVVQRCLDMEGVIYTRLDGSMSEKKRVAEIRRFKESSEVQVFLMSLKAGALGLNLTSAQRVILTDPWWNPATEDQATDRVYRIGQEKKVEIIRLIMQDSVEEGIVAIQERKRELISKTGLGQAKNAEEKRQNLQADLASLIMGKF